MLCYNAYLLLLSSDCLLFTVRITTFLSKCYYAVGVECNDCHYTSIVGIHTLVVIFTRVNGLILPTLNVNPVRWHT